MITVNALKDRLYLEGLEYFGKFYSMYAGRCEDNKDPKNQNRIKVSCNEVFGLNQVHEFWVLPLNIPMTEDFYVIQPPNVGEEVILFFRKGNLRYPVYVRSPQRNNLVDINTILNSNNITPKLFTAILAQTLIDVSDEQFLLIQGGDNNLKIEKNKTTVGKELSSEPNIKGDVLRQQLKDIKEQQSELATVLTTLTNALNAYIVSSATIFPVLAPPAGTAAAPIAQVLLQLQQIQLKLNAINIDANKSEILYNN